MSSIGNHDIAWIAHGYDLAGNRLWREDILAAGQGTPVHLDELYAYDGLNRLVDLQRGNVDTGQGTVGSENWQETWLLDALGNWSAYQQITSGTTTLDQSRLHNKVNEIDNDDNHANQPSGSITATTGTDWADPRHDAAGNMTYMPVPSDPVNGYTATYDAWNRLVELRDGQGDCVARMNYDGLNQRIAKGICDDEYNFSAGRHYYYNDRWQCVEENILDHSEEPGLLLNPVCRYVWGSRYIDELILRQRDTTATPDGTMDETLYAMQDANFNVVALAEPDGDVVQRFVYDAYGKATPLDPDFTAYTGDNFLWECLYTGQRLDLESGLMLYRERYYHTGMGRFVTRDPIGYEGSKWNLYEYVGGAPLSRLDPDGLYSQQEIDQCRRDCRRRWWWNPPVWLVCDFICRGMPEDPPPGGLPQPSPTPPTPTPPSGKCQGTVPPTGTPPVGTPGTPPTGTPPPGTPPEELGTLIGTISGIPLPNTVTAPVAVADCAPGGFWAWYVNQAEENLKKVQADPFASIDDLEDASARLRQAQEAKRRACGE